MTDLDKNLLENLTGKLSNLVTLMNNQNLNEYLKMVIDFSFEANKYFNDSEPWVLKKKDPNRMETILFTISHQIKNISILLSPIIPEATNKVFKIMNLSFNDLKVDKINDMKMFNHDKELNNLEILFTKIENDN